MNWRIIFIGFLFAVLWGSASTATKFGLQSAQPFVIAITRFAIAGSMMLVLTHGILKNRMPEKKEWNQIIIFGLLNISIYLGLYVIAMQYISAGLGSLFLAVNPVMISFISTALFGHKVTYTNVISLMLCISGVIIAAIPLMEHSYASPKGLLIMTASMMTYSLGTIYFTNKKWNNLHILTINGWQTIIGGLFMFPLLLLTYNTSKNTFDINFWEATIWLAIPVSIGAVLSWLLLLNKTPHTASYWLFLCPLFGFIISSITLHEPVSLYTLAGLILVFSGLFIILRYKRSENNPAGFVISE